MFGLAQDMLLFTARSFRVIHTLFDQKFQLYVVDLNYIFFCNLQVQYVETETYDSNQIMRDISLALSTLNLEFQPRRKEIILTPDDLRRRYI